MSNYFEHEAKKLAKHYPSFKNDYRTFLDSLKQNPYQGDDLGNGIRFNPIALKETLKELDLI